MAGKANPEAVKRAQRKLAKSGEAQEIRAAVKEAQEQIEGERREFERRRRQEQMRIQNARIVAVPTDPFGHDGPSVAAAQGKGRGPQPSDKQRAWLQARGLWRKDMTAKQAGAVIEANKHRLTTKQKTALVRAGESLDGMTPAKASALLEILRWRGWRARDYALSREVWRLKPEGNAWRAVVRDPRFGSCAVGPLFRSEADCRTWIGRLVEPSPAAVA